MDNPADTTNEAVGNVSDDESSSSPETNEFEQQLAAIRDAAAAAGYSDPLEAINAVQRFSSQVAELRRREAALVLRLSSREQELHEAHATIAELRAAALPRRGAGRSALLDPAVNHAYQRLKRSAQEADERLAQARQELEAVKFDAQSITGKQLMARVRVLLQENDELARTLGEARVQKLEAELAEAKEFSAELEQNLKESSEYFPLDAEVESMQRVYCTESSSNNSSNNNNSSSNTAAATTAAAASTTSPAAATTAAAASNAAIVI